MAPLSVRLTARCRRVSTSRSASATGIDVSSDRDSKSGLSLLRLAACRLPVKHRDRLICLTINVLPTFTIDSDISNTRGKFSVFAGREFLAILRCQR